MEKTPLVGIITPSLNSGRFIEEAIRSVLAQDYPNIEYIVMDGGSSDETLSILERYRDRLRYVSAPDGGTADAVNRGVAMSRGGILAWLSADDVLLPGAVRAAVAGFAAAPDAAVVYGQGNWIDEDGLVLGRYPTVTPYDPAMFSQACSVCQPACFLRRAAFEEAGMLNAGLRSAFDYDLWIRLSRRHLFVPIPELLAASRMHKANKSLRQKRLMFKESMWLLRKHYGYVPAAWVYSYLRYLTDRRDQFYKPLRPSAPVYLVSLLLGGVYNHGSLARYWKEWRDNAGIRNYLARWRQGG